MKKLTNPMFRNALISDLSAIKGGRRQLYLPYVSPVSRINSHMDHVTSWPVKFFVKHELHHLGNFNIESWQ
jgi:hypothetical protein